MSLSVGVRVGPYEIVSVLGAGGMGEVYRARDAKFHRDVALSRQAASSWVSSRRQANAFTRVNSEIQVVLNWFTELQQRVPTR